MDFGPAGFEFFNQWKQWWPNVKNMESKKTMALKCFLELIFELECHFPGNLQYFRQIKENTRTSLEELESCLSCPQTSLSGPHFYDKIE